MAVPKRKTSKARVRSRHSARRPKIMASGICPQCGGLQEPHRVCASCGYYRGKQVVTVESE